MTVTEAVSLLALDEGGVAQLLSSFGFPFYTDQIRGEVQLPSPPTPTVLT